jgi:hypothetical protein
MLYRIHPIFLIRTRGWVDLYSHALKALVLTTDGSGNTNLDTTGEGGRMIQ